LDSPFGAVNIPKKMNRDHRGSTVSTDGRKRRGPVNLRPTVNATIAG
jgi:hypothetical protein